MRIRGTLAAVAATLLVVGGCASAQDITADGRPGTVNAAGSVPVALTSDNFVAKVARAQLEARSAHVEMSIGAGARSARGSGDLRIGDDPTNTQMSATMTLPGMGDMEVRLVDQVLYTNLGPMTQGKFAKLDLTDPNNPIGKTFEDMVGQMDPSRSVKSLEGAITSFERDGAPEQIDGVRAQPYTVVVDPAKVAPDAGGLGGDARALPDELTFRIWVGPDDLPRKLTSQTSGIDLAMMFTDWGQRVDVEAPPAGQITDKDPFSGMSSGLPAA